MVCLRIGFQSQSFLGVVSKYFIFFRLLFALTDTLGEVRPQLTYDMECAPLGHPTFYLHTAQHSAAQHRTAQSTAIDDDTHGLGARVYAISKTPHFAIFFSL